MGVHLGGRERELVRLRIAFTTLLRQMQVVGSGYGGKLCTQLSRERQSPSGNAAHHTSTHPSLDRPMIANKARLIAGKFLHTSAISDDTT